MTYLDKLNCDILDNNSFMLIGILIISTFLFNYFLMKITINLFKLKKSKEKETIVWLITSAIICVSKIWMPVQYFIIINVITIIIGMYYILDRNLEMTIISSVLDSSLLIVDEIIFSNIFKVLYMEENDIYMKIYRLSLACFIILLFVLSFIIIKKFNLKIDLKNISNSKNKKSIILEGIICCSVIFLNSLGLLFLDDKFIIPIAVMDIIVLGYYYLRDAAKVNEIDANNLKIKNLEFYNNNLSAMYDEIRSFKHDFINIIQGLGGYIKTNDLEGLKKMYERLQENLKEINNIEMLNPDIINDPALYNILNTKYGIAKECGVDMEIEVMIDFKELDVDRLDLCRIFGILLDNAIEAAKECDKKEVYIKFYKDLEKDRNLIKIENTYNNRDIDMNKIFDKEYTSKSEKNSHGLGLWRAKKILNKNNNLNLSSSKGITFVQQLEIYDSKVLTKV